MSWRGWWTTRRSRTPSTVSARASCWHAGDRGLADLAAVALPKFVNIWRPTLYGSRLPSSMAVTIGGHRYTRLTTDVGWSAAFCVDCAPLPGTREDAIVKAKDVISQYQYQAH